jgi:hypothetical protein
VNRLAADVAQDTLDQGHALAAARLCTAGPVNTQGRAVVAGRGRLADLAFGQSIAEADIHRGFLGIPANDSQEHIHGLAQMRIIFSVKNVAGSRKANFYIS